MSVRVKLEKIQESHPNSSGIDNGYWITGTLMSEPAVGESLLVARDCRNGVERPGLFFTSWILEIRKHSPTETDLVTENSTWRLTHIED